MMSAKPMKRLKNWSMKKSCPLPDKTKWFLKMAILVASKHKMVLEIHILNAKETGVTEEKIIHAFRLLIPTRCFSNFMEAHSVVKGTE